MATDQQFCLRWNNHQSTLISVFDSLLENGTLVDCTLAAEGKYLKAHKVVLSACSPYLETLLSQHYEKHPIVILKDVKFTELKSMMDYMYRGEVNISQDQLGTFLKAAESLQIKGLSDNGDDATGPTTKRQEASARPSVTEVRNVETKRPAPSADLSDASREGSISPSSLRKRRRTRRSSQGDDPDSHLDSTSNACDFPINTSQTTTPLSVPSTTVVPTPVQNLPKQIVKQEPSISRIDNLNSTIAPESGLLKEKIEPPSEPLLEPKTEYLDYMNNENSIEVEDLTLDDDEDLDSSMDASRPGPSHGDMSNQGYQWPMGDQSGTDEIFMAAQQAVGAATGQQRDSQDDHELEELYVNEVIENHDYMVGSDSTLHPLLYLCTVCTQQFRSQATYLRHSCVEQADSPCLDDSETDTAESDEVSTPKTNVISPSLDQKDADALSEIQPSSGSATSSLSTFPPPEMEDCPSAQIKRNVVIRKKLSISSHDATCQTDASQNVNSGSKLKPMSIKQNPPQPKICTKCGKTFKLTYKLNHHACGTQPKSNPLPYGTLGKPPYKCECGSVQLHKASFCRHIHHECILRKQVDSELSERLKFMKSLGAPPYKCSKCEAVFKTKTKYIWEHVQGCGKPKQHACQFCGNKFQNSMGVKSHLRVSHAVCSLCRQYFNTKSDLEDHQRKEHIKCSFCEELFYRKDQLYYHVERKHFNTPFSLSQFQL